MGTGTTLREKKGLVGRSRPSWPSRHSDILSIAVAAPITLALLLGAPDVALAAAKPAMRYIAANSGNYTNQNGRNITRVIIHTIEGSEAGAISWFRNPASNVSAHYIVSHTGRITQMVDDDDIAWHAGNWSYNQTAIGIENEGYAGRNNWTDTQYDALAALVRYLTDEYNIPRDRNHIIGHAEVPNQSHWDPGPNFDWDGFMDRLRGNGGGGNTQPPPQPPPVSNPGAPSTGRYGIEVTASALNVRDGIWGTVLGSLTSGQRFVAISTKSGWYRIFWGGRQAWVYGGYVQHSPGGSAAVIDTSWLNVRTGPGTANARIGAAGNGQAYVETGASSGWKRIQFDRRQGWVHGGYTSATHVR